jgi:hypothetical protein
VRVPVAKIVRMPGAKVTPWFNVLPLVQRLLDFVCDKTQRQQMVGYNATWQEARAAERRKVRMVVGIAAPS